MKFEVGKSYGTRSLGDYDCIHSFEIIARTEETVTIKVRGQTVKRRLGVNNGDEYFKPFGSYSLSATIFANENSIRTASEA